MMILKKIAKLLFNRVFYVIFAMAVQLGWLLTIFLRLAGYSRYMSFILDVISILVVLKIVNRKINPSYKLAWTMLILCLPNFWPCFVSCIWTFQNCCLYAGSI